MHALCLGPSLGNIVRIHEGIAALLESLDAPPTNATFDTVTGAFTITLSSQSMEGFITSSDDLSDGLDVGQSATAAWTLSASPSGGTSIGEGSFAFLRSTTGFSVTGTGSTDNGQGCQLDVTSLDLMNSSPSNLGTGTLTFSSRSTRGTMTGTVTFDGSDTGEVAGQFQGEAVLWTFDLVFFFIVFQ